MTTPELASARPCSGVSGSSMAGAELAELYRVHGSPGAAAMALRRPARPYCSVKVALAVEEVLQQRHDRVLPDPVEPVVALVDPLVHQVRRPDRRVRVGVADPAVQLIEDQGGVDWQCRAPPASGGAAPAPAVCAGPARRTRTGGAWPRRPARSTGRRCSSCRSGTGSAGA